MLKLQNERRRRRGAAALSEDSQRADVEAGSASAVLGRRAARSGGAALAARLGSG